MEFLDLKENRDPPKQMHFKNAEALAKIVTD